MDKCVVIVRLAKPPSRIHLFIHPSCREGFREYQTYQRVSFYDGAFNFNLQYRFPQPSPKPLFTALHTNPRLVPVCS